MLMTRHRFTEMQPQLCRKIVWLLLPLLVLVLLLLLPFRVADVAGADVFVIVILLILASRIKL